MTSEARRSQKRRSALAADTDSHVGDACPYLGLASDPRTHYAFPSRANCCHTHQPALLIDLDYQSAYCLSDRWPTCSLYQTARRKGVRRSRLQSGRGWLLVAGMVAGVAVLAVLLFRLWLSGAFSIPSPAPTAPATTQAAPMAAGGGTPTPSPTDAPSATPTAPPENPGQTAVAVLPATQEPSAPTRTGTQTPTMTPTTVTPTPIVTPTSTLTPTLPPATLTPTGTSPPPTPTLTPSPSATATSTSTPPPPSPTSTSTLPPPTPTATQTPSPSPTPTDTPAPTSTPAPTAAPSATAPPTVPPPTPTATATATATPTQEATYPAPVPVAPADGQSFGQDDTITLEWTSVGALDENAFYAITVEYAHLDETWYDETPRVRDTRWTLSEHAYLLDLANDGLFRWWVQVMRQTGVDASGNPIVVAASPASVARVLHWHRASPPQPPPVATPAPPPA